MPVSRFLWRAASLDRQAGCCCWVTGSLAPGRTVQSCFYHLRIASAAQASHRTGGGEPQGAEP